MKPIEFSVLAVLLSIFGCAGNPPKEEPRPPAPQPAPAPAQPKVFRIDPALQAILTEAVPIPGPAYREEVLTELASLVRDGPGINFVVSSITTEEGRVRSRSSYRGRTSTDYGRIKDIIEYVSVRPGCAALFQRDAESPDRIAVDYEGRISRRTVPNDAGPAYWFDAELTLLFNTRSK